MSSVRSPSSQRNGNNEDSPIRGATTERHRAATELPRLIDTSTLAEFLGVGERHVRRLVDERRIPFVKVGRYVRFDVAEVAFWIERNRVPQGRPALHGRRV